MTPPTASPVKRRRGQPSALNRPLERPDGTRTTVAERVLELASKGVPLRHAAGASGITAHTLQEWLTIGGKIASDIATRRRTRTSLTPHEQACWEFSTQTADARAGWIANALVGLNEARQGGRCVTKTVEKVDADGNVIERTTTVEELPPNVNAATWMLSRCEPAEFGPQRLEVTGPEGGPVQVELDVSGFVADVRSFLADRAEARAVLEVGP